MSAGFVPSGTYVAMLTPMNLDESLRLDVIPGQVDRFVDAGIDGLFCVGTNGEAYALSHGEKLDVIAAVVVSARGRLPVCAGVGCVTTRETVELAREAEKLGASLLAVVTPYYAEVSQPELERHYRAVAEAVTIPIMLYNIPDLSNQSVFDAYQAIVETNAVDIVSNSFGGPEGVFTAAYNDGTDFTGILRTFDDLIRQGNAEGITFVASTGDNGGLELPSLSYFLGEPGATWLPGIEWPASLPHVTAVGGTNLVTSSISGSLQSTYVAENAFGDPLLPYDPFGVGNTVSGGYWGSGGGPSVVFTKPLYQFLVNTGSSMRSVPDISLQMGGCPAIAAKCGSDFTPPFPESDVVTAFGGNFFGAIGTSVSVQDFAGLLALERQNLGTRLGNVNFLIYGLAALQNFFSPLPDYHQNIPGFNGLFSSSPGGGYNMVVGNGTPFGKNFILAPFVPAAGNPQTPSNP